MNRTVHETNNALLLVSFPHQLLHAISALKYDRMLHSIPEDAPVTILIWSYQFLNHSSRAKIRKVFFQALQGFSQVKILFPTLFERIFYLSPYRLITDRASWIRRQLKAENYSVFYYSHDESADHTAQAVMQALPEARRVCFGDPPGFLYPTCNFLQKNKDGHKNTVKQRIWQSRLCGLKNWLSASELIIAVDFRLPCEAVEMSIVHVMPSQFLVETLNRLKSGFQDAAAIESLLLEEWAGYESMPFLLLISNLSASGLTTEQREVALYVDICQAYVSPGETIYIKPHIGTSREFLNQLISKLGLYRVIVFPVAIQQLPIEFFSALLARSHILSVSSSSALISKLFGYNVAHALDEERIRQFIEPDCHSEMTKANSAIIRKISKPSALEHVKILGK